MIIPHQRFKDIAFKTGSCFACYIILMLYFYNPFNQHRLEWHELFLSSYIVCYCGQVGYNTILYTALKFHKQHILEY